MEIRRAWRFELDPNNEVRTLLAKHAGVARFAWNWSLKRRIERFQTQEGKAKFTNAIEEHRALNDLKGSDFPWMYEVSKCAPQEALRDLDKAFKAFWARRKEGIGFPKFKRKHVSKDSFRLTGSICIRGRYVKLPRLGAIRLKEKIKPKRPVTGQILSATVSRVADRWFVSLTTVEKDLPEPKPVEGPVCGVDLGIKTFATLSDGTKIESPKPLKTALSRLRRAQVSHARKRKGSQNRRKSAQRIARIHAKIANVRKDFLHKTTTMLAKTKSVIVIESLNVRGMVRNHSLARSVSDAGWGEFGRQLGYKTAWHGSRLIEADRWYPSSKTCSDCGQVLDKLLLSVREWVCPSCGVVHDRDHNAAINLENLAYREFSGNVGPQQGGPRKPVEIPLTAEREQSRPTSHGSMKQEANIEAGQ